MDISVQDPLVGQVLDGRYRVESRVAVGGMATVYRAVDTRLDRVLALKVMHPALAADTGFVERFIREAKAVARLAHPNVVGVFDQGQDGTYVYLAMEYVAGCTLRDVLKERGALQPRAALDILEPVLAALGAAHRAGLVHRDMKPENVLIGDDGRVKVADFGLVRAVDTQTSASTGALLGTVSYLAPEQIGHGTVGQRSDVYACGLVLYEMLAGRKPYTGDTPMKVVYQHLNEDVPAPSAVVPSVAPGLDALVARASARDPERRPADAVEMLAELRAVRAALTADQLDGRPGDPRAAAALAADGLDHEGTVQMRLRPPAAGVAAGSEERTSVVPLPVADAAGPADSAGAAGPAGGAGSAGADDAALNRTSRLILPAPVRDEPEHTTRTAVRRGRRGPLAVLLALLVLLGVGAGVWYISDGQFTKVPGVLALPQDQAQKKLSAAGLDSKVKQAFSLNVPRGSVIATDPGPGKRIRSNGTVTLTVSKGPQVVRVPDVTGRSLDQARQEITKAGLTAGTVNRVFSSDVANGQVVSTDPAGATDRAPGTPVAITVSRGEPVEVPDVVGQSVTDAQQALEEAGLKVVLAPGKVYSDEADKDTVAVESPDAGAQAGTGDTVTITVSKGQQMVDVPDVKGKHRDEAKQILQDAGFDVRVIDIFFGDTVFSESPGGGGQAPKGATITIWVR
ncbi:Stk1 family PASTA domain-containing Ser/Thr kinase [Actinacidiphila acidipaludis]|uniref:non-specific serine/threonine protein kinase n=1 Tax=Actinacidiphila acidipaludis TaxID=2873382 RepID=A0ABS7Q092_9ACTN|nr:Stk1 family PASTA domain-containing Ser/Thr kinase [Streptomyces acidipaludis]MBY8876552.1 Stk1 family PASTA domain-containing Ser/Thr kinase [Streptomyces acidipaludis]